jgi:O-antigen ligase
VYAVGILGLFVLDRNRAVRTSRALWISIAWLCLAGSRTVSEWWEQSEVGGSGDAYFKAKWVEGNPVERNIFAVLLLLGLAVLIRRRHQVGQVLRGNRRLLAFFAYCALSALWSDDPVLALKRWTKATGDLVIVLIVLTDPNPAVAFRRFLARTGFLLIPASVLLIKYYPWLARAYNQWDGTQAFVGVTDDKNMLGLVCLVAGLGSVWRVLQELMNAGERRVGPLMAHLTIVAMALWLFHKADSMTSLSCFAIGTVLMLAASMPAVARRAGLVHLPAAALVSVAFASLFLNVGSGLVESMGRDSTLTGRTDLWSELIDMNPNVIVGAGFESFWTGARLDELWSIFRWHPNEAHNGYLEVYLNLGCCGLALMALVIGAGYRNVIRALGQRTDAAALRFAYCVVSLIYSFTEAGFRMLNPGWILFLLATATRPDERRPEAAVQAFDQPWADPAATRIAAGGFAPAWPNPPRHVHHARRASGNRPTRWDGHA